MYILLLAMQPPLSTTTKWFVQVIMHGKVLETGKCHHVFSSFPFISVVCTMHTFMEMSQEFELMSCKDA